tara:strand:- start:2621 stop:2989 length:369 start_codon:yes stop_codon:yes gene_type:complete
MEIPDNLLYTSEHEWILINGDTAIVGITDFAQGELGDVIFVELPVVGELVNEKDTVGTIEAVKTVADIFSPLKGTISEVNVELEEMPEHINNSPYNNGWILKINNFDKSKNLLTAEEYKNII